MPLTKCTKNGVSGYRWGTKGVCYPGAGGKKKALAQGLAENKGNEQAFRQELSKAGLLEDPFVQAFLEDIEPKGSDRLLAGVASQLEKEANEDEWAYAYVSQEERKKMPLSDFAWPSQRKYPIKDQKHLDAAVKLLGRAPASMQAAIKRRIIEIAHRKGLTLPAEWTKKSSK